MSGVREKLANAVSVSVGAVEMRDGAYWVPVGASHQGERVAVRRLAESEGLTQVELVEDEEGEWLVCEVSR